MVAKGHRFQQLLQQILHLRQPLQQTDQLHFARAAALPSVHQMALAIIYGAMALLQKILL